MLSNDGAGTLDIFFPGNSLNIKFFSFYRLKLQKIVLKLFQ